MCFCCFVFVISVNLCHLPSFENGKVNYLMSLTALQNPTRWERKSELSDELDSTAESHPMNTSKRARIDMNRLPQPLVFLPETIARIFVELGKVIRFQEPYDDESLGWQDDVVWDKIIERLKLPMKVWIDDLKVTVLGYYDMYQKGTLSSLDLSDSASNLANAVFKKARLNVGEYLSSCFCPPCHLALEYPRESSSTVSYGYGPPATIQPIQSFPYSSENSRFKDLIKGLKKIEACLTPEELSWAEFEMPKYDGRINMFLFKNNKERVEYVKNGWNAKASYGDRCDRVPSSL